MSLTFDIVSSIPKIHVASSHQASRNMSELLSNELAGFHALSGNQTAQADSFQTMVKEISRICKEASKAQEIDRPLLAYRVLAKQEPELVIA